MKLHNLLTVKNFCFFEEQIPKKEIIAKLLDKLWNDTHLKNEDVTKEEIYKEFIDREREQTTAIGSGFAFPHARLNNIKGVYVMIAASKSGVDFESMDKKPCHFIILTVVPRHQPGILLSSRAAIVSILMNKELQKSFLECSSPVEMHSLIKKQDKILEQEIVARNIMKPVVHTLSPEMTLFEAARELHRHHVDSLPVINENSEILGKLSCHDLFSFKLPEFFNTLHSISFIKNMDPFEKYFESDQKVTIGSLKFKQKIPAISADATLMEIVFEMTVKEREQLYVIEEGKLLGTIDRYRIIDKILISSINGADS